jgi:hypothetical protein
MAVEHLHLHMRRTHWETKRHPDLGPHLQEALDKLEAEGWEVVCGFAVGQNQELILKRDKIGVRSI